MKGTKLATSIAMAAAAMLKVFFRACYILYGKNNKLFGKKIAATGIRPAA